MLATPTGTPSSSAGITSSGLIKKAGCLWVTETTITGSLVGSRAQRSEGRLDLLPPGLQPLRQLQVPAQLLRRFVHLESGAIRGDLAQEAVRRPEVDAPEVLPVQDVRDLQAVAPQVILPGPLFLFVPGPEGDVVHGAAAEPEGPVIEAGKSEMRERDSGADDIDDRIDRTDLVKMDAFDGPVDAMVQQFRTLGGFAHGVPISATVGLNVALDSLMDYRENWLEDFEKEMEVVWKRDPRPATRQEI